MVHVVLQLEVMSSCLSVLTGRGKKSDHGVLPGYQDAYTIPWSSLPSSLQSPVPPVPPHSLPRRNQIGVLVDEFVFTAEDFLRRKGLLGRGIWKRTWGSLNYGSVPFGVLGDASDAGDWALPPNECPPDTPMTDLDAAQQIKDWPSYYTARGIAFSSPAALVLHFPLTVLHVLRILESKGRVSLDPGTEVRIHLIGTAQELDQRLAFKELSHVLPGVTLRFAFIGHEISPEYHLKRFSCADDKVCSAVGCRRQTRRRSRSFLLWWWAGGGGSTKHALEQEKWKEEPPPPPGPERRQLQTRTTNPRRHAKPPSPSSNAGGSLSWGPRKC